MGRQYQYWSVGKMINQEGWIVLIQGEARKTRGAAMEAAGIVLIVIALVLLVTFGLAYVNSEFTNFGALLFWLAVIFIGPAGTVLVIIGHDDIVDGEKAAARAIEVIRQSRFQ